MAIWAMKEWRSWKSTRHLPCHSCFIVRMDIAGVLIYNISMRFFCYQVQRHTFSIESLTYHTTNQWNTYYDCEQCVIMCIAWCIWAQGDTLSIFLWFNVSTNVLRRSSTFNNDPSELRCGEWHKPLLALRSDCWVTERVTKDLLCP